MNVLLSNIQRFSLQDGTGIRTTIFLKGCWLHCPWCANPENISCKPEKYVYKNEIKQFGYEISCEELEIEILKDIEYYEYGGGVTYSGGEALLQMPRMESMLDSLKEKRINQCIETSLYAPKENLRIACEYIDKFIVDAKILIEDMARDILGCDVKIYIDNLDYLHASQKPIQLRVPLVNPYTIDDNNLYIIKKIIDDYNIQEIEIFRVHNLGEYKYAALGRKQFVGQNISDERIMDIKKYLGEKVKIITF